MNDFFNMQFTPRQVNEISNLGLAHVGDCVFELLCRTYLCTRGDQTNLKLHKDTVALVNAPAQAKFVDVLLPMLTDSEKEYYRRGRNAHNHGAPKAATSAEYAKATGLEALFGALYLQGQTERLNLLFNRVMEAMYGI